MSITPLPFDTSLFKYPVGRVKIEADFNEEEFLKEAAGFQLVYLFSEQEIEFKSKDILAVDRKVRFQKEVEKQLLPSMVTSYSGQVSPSLLDLALQSGVYSRFKTDTRLTAKEFESLYTIWVSKAIASGALLCTEDGKGMISYATTADALTVGLLAVDASARGKGYGRKLMQAVEAKADELGKKVLIVPTQEQNIPACKFYESLGYRISHKEYVYHWWRSN